MTETATWRARHTIAVGGASAAGGGTSRLAVRLWTLLHAQALLQGTIGGMGSASCMEDDRRRLAARRERTNLPRPPLRTPDC